MQNNVAEITKITDTLVLKWRTIFCKCCTIFAKVKHSNNGEIFLVNIGPDIASKTILAYFSSNKGIFKKYLETK